MRQRKSKTIKTNEAQKLLISEVMKHYSPLEELVARTTTAFNGDQFPAQQWVNWRQRGRVPLQKAFIIADILFVSPYALNYAEISKMLGKGPSWEEAVRSCKFLPEVIIQRVLSRREPSLDN